MNFVVLFNILNAILVCLGLLFILTKTRVRILWRDYRFLFLLLLSLILFDNISNILEWSGISGFLDSYEDHLEVLEALTFGVIFYCIFQKRLVNQIQESESKYRLIVENQTDLVVKVDAAGKFRFASPSYCNMFGKTEQELIGKEFHPLVHEEDLEKTLQEMENLYKPPYSCTCTQRAKTVHGWRWLTWADKAILDENNRIYAIIGVGRDVTEQVESELERQQLLEKIHSKNTEMQSIISIASHDLKSPLVNIMGFNSELKKSCDQLADLFKDQGHPELKKKYELLFQDIEEAQSFIHNGAKKMQSLIDGLLTISRIGTQEIQIEAVEMNPLIEDILRSMNYQIQENNIEVIVEALPACHGDPRQVNQIFSNLVDNAIKYRHPERDCKIKVSGTQIGNHCQYSITDNGIGIRQEDLKKIFEIYHRLNNQDDTQGHGLGLTIISRILERLGGSVRVQSEFGQGSTFLIRLPAAAAKKEINIPEQTGRLLEDPV